MVVLHNIYLGWNLADESQSVWPSPVISSSQLMCVCVCACVCACVCVCVHMCGIQH